MRIRGLEKLFLLQTRSRAKSTTFAPSSTLPSLSAASSPSGWHISALNDRILPFSEINLRSFPQLWIAFLRLIPACGTLATMPIPSTRPLLLAILLLLCCFALAGAVAEAQTVRENAIGSTSLESHYGLPQLNGPASKASKDASFSTLSTSIIAGSAHAVPTRKDD